MSASSNLVMGSAIDSHGMEWNAEVEGQCEQKFRSSHSSRQLCLGRQTQDHHVLRNINNYKLLKIYGINSTGLDGQVSIYQMSSFIKQEEGKIELTEIFNEQHASMILQEKLAQSPHFTTLVLNNVGVKIMKDAFEKFADHPVTKVSLYYNWNEIMMMPKLVCYDKNTWKTLQQLANWNRQWSLFLRPCLSLKQISVQIVCSWADDQFTKAFLEGLAALPNIESVSIQIASKNEKVGEMLWAFKSAKIFPNYSCKFNKMD